MKKLWGIFLILYVPVSAWSQLQWDGEGDAVSWNDAANWRPDGVPAPGAIIQLNNQWVSNNYQVFLPSGDIAVTVTSLEISPATGSIIELINPPQNISSTAFTANGEGDAVIINEGGIFRNASGASSGTPVGVTTSNFFRINNGGKYIHNCPRGHTATLVARLSSAPGTEEGIFEFDVPGASFPFSLSARKYGKLVFSSFTHGSPVTYFASGSQQATIRSDLQMNGQVNLTLDMNADIQIDGNLHVKQHAVCNLSNSTNHTQLMVAKDLLLEGTLTESGSGVPEVILHGNALQTIYVSGSWNNSVGLRLDNMHGAVLQHDLALSHSLALADGNLFLGQYDLVTPAIHQVGIASPANNHLVTNGTGMLHLPGIGVSPVVFPVGAAADQYTPVILQQGHGANYAVRVEPGFPLTIFDPAKAVLNTWIVRSSVTLPVDISFGYFVPANTGGLFNPGTTVDAGIYINGWNVFARAIQPVPGEGLIYWATTTITSLTADDDYSLVLGNAGSILSRQNPFLCRMNKRNGKPELWWEFTEDSLTGVFEIQRAISGGAFQAVAQVPFRRLQVDYSWMDANSTTSANYRIKLIANDTTSRYSNIVSFNSGRHEQLSMQLFPNPAVSNITLLLPPELSGEGEVSIYDVLGKMLKKKQYDTGDGRLLNVEIGNFAAGVYILRCCSAGSTYQSTSTFIKSR